jgi:hypothetical protein
MRISVVIFLSLALNVTLALLVFHNHSAPQPLADAALVANSTITSTASPSSAPDNVSASGSTARVSWADLQAKDLKEFIRRLRAVDCPEGTIQDLVLAEVNRRYAIKAHAIWQDPEWLGQNDYWKPYQRKPDAEKQKKSRERQKAMQTWNKEKTALIVELFGFDVEKQRMKEEGFDADNMGWNPSGNLAFLPEAKRDAVQKYLEDFQEKEQDFYASTMGGWDAEARAKQKQLQQEKLDGLAQFLTPQELREYELRNSQVAQQIASDLHGVDITREQYEAMFDLRKKYGDSIYNWGDANNTPEQRKQIEQNKKDMEAEIAAAIGADKGLELQRAQDYQYQQLASLAKHNDLPADTAPKIYDYKQTAEKAVEAVNASTDLTPEQRQAALTQIRTETEASLKATLGDKLFKRYQSNGGYWINNLAPAAVISR